MKMWRRGMTEQPLCNLLCAITVDFVDASQPLVTAISDSPGQSGDRGESQKQLRSVHAGFDSAELEVAISTAPLPPSPHPQSSALSFAVSVNSDIYV